MLQDAIAGVDAHRKTLTVFNYEGSDGLRRRIERFFSVRNVRVEDGETDPPTPRNYAILSDADGIVATSTVESLRSFIRATELMPFQTHPSPDTPDVVAQVDDTLCTIHAIDRGALLRRSHGIETLARETGDGTLRVCVQQHAHLDESIIAAYRAVADAGVDVHVYGVPEPTDSTTDGLSDTEELTVHGDRSEELGRTWVTLYDGGNRPERMAALVVEERADGYHGFWTPDADVVETLDRYLASAYR